MTEQRSGTDRRATPRGGRRAADAIADLKTHQSVYVTPQQLADYWGVHVRTIHQWLKSGKLKGFRPGGVEWRIRRSDALLMEVGLFKAERLVYPGRRNQYEDW